MLSNSSDFRWILPINGQTNESLIICRGSEGGCLDRTFTGFITVPRTNSFAGLRLPRNCVPIRLSQDNEKLVKWSIVFEKSCLRWIVGRILATCDQAVSISLTSPTPTAENLRTSSTKWRLYYFFSQIWRSAKEG